MHETTRDGMVALYQVYKTKDETSTTGFWYYRFRFNKKTIRKSTKTKVLHDAYMQILGLLVSRAAAEGVDADNFNAFLKRHLLALKKVSLSHPVPIDERIAKSMGRCRLQ